ncbi:MAG TPA: hypothetical protein VN837_05215, partial [Chloroflexota bacterium]|nr:hypothetical protein [Chloroflexota bacterium]
DTTSNKITVTAQGNIELNATQDVKITGMNITLTAQQALNMEAQGGAATMKGVSTSIQAQTSGEMKANAQVSISGEAGVQISTPAMAQVSGNPIMLN